MKKKYLYWVLFILLLAIIVWLLWFRHKYATITPRPHTYDTLSSGVKVNLNAVSFINPAHCVVVGNNGTIILTKNGGHSWENVGGMTTANLYGAAMADSQTAIAVGDSGKILRSTDGGLTWGPVLSANVYFLKTLRNVAFYNDHNGYAVGDSGAIFYTSDAGISWSKKHGDSTQSLYGLSYNSNNIPYVVGSNGLVLNGADKGGTWDKSIITTKNLRSIHFALTAIPYVHSDTGFIVGDKGTILKTVNGGSDWDTITSPTSKSLRSVFLSSPHKGFAVGDSGTVLRYNGKKWISLARPSDKTLNAVDPVSEDPNATIVGEDGGIWAGGPPLATDGSTLSVSDIGSCLLNFKLTAGSLKDRETNNLYRYFEVCSTIDQDHSMPSTMPGGGWAQYERFYCKTSPIDSNLAGHLIPLPDLQILTSSGITNGFITCYYKDDSGNFYLLGSWVVEYP